MPVDGGRCDLLTIRAESSHLHPTIVPFKINCRAVGCPLAVPGPKACRCNYAGTAPVEFSMLDLFAMRIECPHRFASLVPDLCESIELVRRGHETFAIRAV